MLRLSRGVAVLLIACAVVGARAQDARPDTIRVLPASAEGARVTGADSTHSDTLRSKSPGMAMLLSAVLPGAGQAYNESYWKIPIVAGLGVYFIGEFIANNNRAQDYRDQYAASQTLTLPNGDTRLLTLREFYKNQRDAFAWYFFLVYVLNIVDAYVDASLYGFDVGDNLSIHLLPTPQRVGLQLRF